MNNTQNLLQKIKQLEEELKKVKSCKKYGLVFEEKPENFEEKSKNALPLLKEIKELEIKNFEKREEQNKLHYNLIIEGDNFHSLSCLQYTHKNKIDVIYIDPPYNTGNKDFIYNDSYVDKEDSYRHSKWLSFMKKRLILAKDLLSEKGVIFISIDDNEFAQLKMLCDEIFGEENFIDIFSWNRTKTPANLSKKSRKVIEYILCYSKNIKNNDGLLAFTSVSNTSNGMLGQTSKEKILIFPKDYVDTGLKNGIYIKGIYKTANYTIELLEDTEVKNGYFTKDINLKGKFSWSQNKLNEEVKMGTKISIRTISFSPSYIRKEQSNKLPPKNLINEENNVGTSEDGTKIIRDIFLDVVFNFPKPVNLLKYLISLINNKSSIILDFFAGSGTTGHAVLELNKEDLMTKTIYFVFK